MAKRLNALPILIDREQQHKAIHINEAIRINNLLELCSIIKNDHHRSEETKRTTRK